MIVYCVIDDPPVAPAVIVIVAAESDPVAEIVGACGTVVAVTPDEADEADDVPYGLVAATVNVYDVADDRPVI